MNFSNTIKYSGLCEYSPNGQYLAIIKGSSLIVYIIYYIYRYMKLWI